MTEERDTGADPVISVWKTDVLPVTPIPRATRTVLAHAGATYPHSVLPRGPLGKSQLRYCYAMGASSLVKDLHPPHPLYKRGALPA